MQTVQPQQSGAIISPQQTTGVAPLQVDISSMFSLLITFMIVGLMFRMMNSMMVVSIPGAGTVSKYASKGASYASAGVRAASGASEQAGGYLGQKSYQAGTFMGKGLKKAANWVEKSTGQ